MILLIAESKTMLATQRDVAPEEFGRCTPLYEDVATEIMESLKSEPASSLSSMLKLSGKLAGKMREMVYEFGYKSTGNRAIEAFTGVVFKALDYSSLTEEARKKCGSDVRIISSLYGWLRPEDIVKPYRLDFTSVLEEGPSAGKPLNSFWRMDVTKALVNTLRQQDDTDILNLLPGDAAKCIDWKLVKRFAKVWKVDFQQVQEGGVLKTPSAEKLKTLRGMLLRQILTEDLDDVAALMRTSSPSYLCEGTPVYPDHLRFLC